MGGVVQIGGNKSGTVSRIEKKTELMTGTLILIILQAIFFLCIIECKLIS